MTEEEVIRAVRSFPPGSAGGPDGVRPQNPLEMISCRESGPVLSSALTGFVNFLLRGKIHPQVSPVLFSGNLIALEKKSGGIRPIAVGYTLRRIAATCANSYATNQLAGYFSPIQPGVWTPGGSEAAVHATRRFIEAMPDGHVVAKLDFCNAFNSMRRDLMLRSVLSAVPGIYRFCHLCYTTTHLSSNSTTEQCCHRRVRIKAVHWAFSCSVSPSIRICCACNLSWWLEPWMT